MAKRWLCKVCGYVAEGDAPPDRCPVCDAPREQFVLLEDSSGESARADAGAAGEEPVSAATEGEPGASGADTDAVRTLEEARDRARERLAGVCAVYPRCDGAPGNVCNREAYGRAIGLGGAGTGASFANNVSALARIQLRMRVVGPHFEPDIRTTFLGQSLSMPVMASSTAGLGGHHVMDERAFADAAIAGCLAAGTLSWRGDTAGYSLEHHPSLDALEAAGGRGIPIFKPRSQDDLKRLIDRAVRIGCPAVGVDLDGFGSTNMARAGQPVFRKSVADLRELVRHAAVPFIAKGVMDPEDAEACAEAGVAVVAVSNHGGRVLDCTPGVAEVFPAVAERVGDSVVLTADGGVRTGYDVLKLLALGAQAVLVGRDVIRAAVGGGATGVQLQMERFGEVFARALRMTGCPSVADIHPGVILRR